MNGSYVVRSISLHLPGLRGFCLQWGWLFHILSKCTCPVPLAGRVCWCIYWKRWPFLHLGGLLDLAGTCVSPPLPFALAVCICANAAAVLQQARLRRPQPCQTLPPQDPRSAHRTEKALTPSLFLFLFFFFNFFLLSYF